MTIQTKTKNGRFIHVTVPDRTTWEDLESEMILRSSYNVVIPYGDKILVGAAKYNPDGPHFFGATYEFTSDDHSHEGFICLSAVSRVSFEDIGHALEWAMKQ